MDLYESYLNRAKKYLVEDEEDLELTDVDTEEDTDEVDVGDEDDAEEPVELDMSAPVCPECGAELIPVGEIDTTEEDEDGNPIYTDEEADAIDLLQGLGYVIYKPVVEEDVDDFADEDEDIGDEDLDDEEIEDEE